MKRKEVYFYFGRVLACLPGENLAALYIESQLNDYVEWFRAILAAEIASRPNGLEALLEVEVALHKQGIIEAYWPMHVAVLANFDKRGELKDVISGLEEKGNLENAVRIIAAGCDWLPEEEMTDEMISMVADILKTAIGKE